MKERFEEKAVIVNIFQLSGEKKTHQTLDIKMERGVNHLGMKECIVYRIIKC